MNAAMSYSGIECVVDVNWGSHFCQFYKTRNDLADALVPYFKAGLANQEQCLWVIASPFNADDARNALRNAVPDLAAREKAGDILIIDHTEWYTRNGDMSADQVLQGWVEKQKRALELGYKGLRLTGNTYWVEDKDWQSFADYECMVNHTFRDHRIIALCSYCLERCPSEGIVDVVKNHDFAVVRRAGVWQVIENSSLKQAKVQLRKLNSELETRVAERTSELERLVRLHEEAEEFNNRMIESSADCIKILDMEGKVQFMSPSGQKLLEIDNIEPLVGTQWASLWKGEDQIAARKAIEEAIQGRTGRMSGFCPTMRGNAKWWDVIVTPILGSDGKPQKLLAVSRDITERKKFEEALEEAVQVRDEFLSICSHELKTPLTSMKLQAQMLRRKVARGDSAALATDKVNGFATNTERQVDRLSRLVDDMLDISRINNKRLNLEIDQVDLSRLTSDVLERFEGQAEQAGCTLEVTTEKDVTGLWDRYRIEQVVANLVSNALKYGRSRPVQVHVGKRGDRAVLTVRDQGIGIDMKDRERIFQRFERAISAENISGLGLGLYISRKIVAAHHGKISVQSSVGEGSEFSVELPLAG